MTIYAGAAILVAKSSPTSSPPPHSTCASPATDQCTLSNRKGAKLVARRRVCFEQDGEMLAVVSREVSGFKVDRC